MFTKLFLLFSAISLLEIFVFIKLGSLLGAFATVGLVIATALLGSALVKKQGLQLIAQLQQRLAQGELPGQQLVEGIMLIIVGVLLVTPGFVTDIVGLLLLQPGIRAAIAKTILKNISLSSLSMGNQFTNADHGFSQEINKDVIEGEFKRTDKDN